MFGASKFNRLLPHPGFNKKNSKAPDYGPLAQASKEAAEIMANLGYEQLDFSRQQYDELSPLLRQITDQQMAIADETAAQGRDYYDYQKSFRPIEQAMMGEAMQDRSGEINAYDAANQADASMMTMSPDQLYALRRSEIEPMVDQAIADSQGAYTRNINQAIRQGLRYGSGMNGITANVGGVGLAQAQAQAAAANAARQGGIQDVRSRAGLGIQLRQGNMAAKNQQQAIDWAKKLDAAGLVKGLPGASAGAYGLATNAGNAAGQNSMAAGNQYVSGMGQAAGTIGSGQNMQIGGLSTILNNQASVYNTKSQANGEIAGALIGGAFGLSDVNLKENIELVGKDDDTGLNLYEFNYIGDERRFQGVMAQEVVEVMPEAVIETPTGHLAVNYAMLGIEMKEV